MGQAYEWGFDLQTTSDDSYLLDYGISDADRLAIIPESVYCVACKSRSAS